MSVTKRIVASRPFQKTVGVVIAEYLRLVWKTSRTLIEPADIYERIGPQQPFIVAMWHGHHFMMPFLKRPHLPAKVLVSRHRDGEINAIAAERLGVGAIRGSGAHDRRFDRKGGVIAFREMLTALEQGCNVALTADIPKVSRVAGAGIVMLGQMSGRPIYPVAVTTSRRFELNTWDRSEVNLPFGRFGLVAGDPIRVPADADEAEIERIRQAIEVALNAVTARARELVDNNEAPRAR